MSPATDPDGGPPKRPYDSYTRASPEVRKLWNAAFFRKIVVEGRTIASVTYEEPYASLHRFQLLPRCGGGWTKLEM